MSSTKKVAVVTGASSGIGLASTKAFLEAGYKVFGIDMNAFDSTNLPSSLNDFAFYQADLTGKDVPRTAMKACKDRFGTVDVLANVAGILDGFCSADTVTEAELVKVMTVNLTVPVLLMKEAIEIMKEGGKGGSIVNVSSRAGSGGAAAGVAYTASKHGLIGASKNVAFRFKDEKIRCNVVSPGGVATNIATTIANFDGEAFQVSKIRQCAALKIESRPFIELHASDLSPWIPVEDVANAIVFMASEKAKTISGVVLPVDCAWSAI